MSELFDVAQSARTTWFSTDLRGGATYGPSPDGAGEHAGLRGDGPCRVAEDPDQSCCRGDADHASAPRSVIDGLTARAA